MTTRTAVFILSLFVISCTPSKKTTNTAAATGPAAVSATDSALSNSEKDGSSFEKAIEIKADNERAGVKAEYEWVANNYPGYKVQKQALMNHNKKAYDVLTISGSKGTKDIYFDISNFFGKF